MKNILTRAMAVICLVGWIIGFGVGFGFAYLFEINDANFGFIGVVLLMPWVILPATIIGFLQSVISLIRWKKLTASDKTVFLIILSGLFIIVFKLWIFRMNF